MKNLKIRWQRLVDEQGETCDRCGVTEESVKEALQMLSRSLKELGIDVILEQSKIDFYRFKEAPLESNRIWIADKPLEEWLEGIISASQCGTACGDSFCRTLEVDGESYEAIPPELIVKAGLLASVELLKGEPQSGGCNSGACSSQPVSAGCGCGA